MQNCLLSGGAGYENYFLKLIRQDKLLFKNNYHKLNLKIFSKFENIAKNDRNEKFLSFVKLKTTNKLLP